jgi:hypothetical protein
MKTMASICFALATLGVVLPATDAAETHDWPPWNGSNHHLTALDNNTFHERTFGLEHLWLDPLGSFLSALSVVDNRLVTALSDGNSDWRVAIDVKSGQELWRYRLVEETDCGHCRSHESLVATPAIPGVMVYGMSPPQRLFALRLGEGNEVWARRPVNEPRDREPFWSLNSPTTQIGGVLLPIASARTAYRARTLVTKDTERHRDFTFVQLCDPQFGGSSSSDLIGASEDDAARMERYVQALTQINELQPDFVVIGGDHVQYSSAATFRQFLKVNEQLTVPCYSAPGNHDFNPTRGDERVMPERLELYRRFLGRDYFAVKHKGHAFVFVNTPLWLAGETEGASEEIPERIRGEYQKHEAWVRQTLMEAKRKGMPVFIIGHHPLNPAQKRPLALGHLSDRKREELFTLFKESGVVAVLGCHGHQVVIADNEGIPFVHSHVTSFMLGTANEVAGEKLGWGFRLWHIEGNSPVRHEFVPLTLGGLDSGR